MGVSFLYHTAFNPALKAPLTERRAARPGRVEVLQVSRPAVDADNRPGPGGTARSILCPPLTQQSCLLEIRSPVLLRPVDSVQRGPCRAVVLEGVDRGVRVGHGL